MRPTPPRGAVQRNTDATSLAQFTELEKLRTPFENGRKMQRVALLKAKQRC